MTNLTSVSDTALKSSTNNSEITVNTYTGEAYVSQRKAAELLGVARTSLQYYLENTLSRPENYDTSQGLSSEMFAFSVQYYALEARSPTDEAKTLLKQITQAGTKAYLYHLAGYTIGVQQPKPTTIEERKIALELLKIEVQEAKLKANIETETAKLSIIASKKHATVEAYITKTEVAKMKLQAAKEKYAEQSKVLHARTTKLLSQGALVKGDMTAGKLDMPTDTITNLLKEHGSTVEPKLANWALRQLGYLTKTHEVTDTGHYYGRNIKSSPRSKTTLARWFPSEFTNLLNQIESTIEDLVNN